MAQQQEALVEAVARAMQAVSRPDVDPNKLTPGPRGSVGMIPVWRLYETMARAAVSAMAEVAKSDSADTGQETVGRPDDDEILEHLPEYIRGEKRCGIQRSVWLTGWFVPWSPRNENENAEGPWSHWVLLAQAILEEDVKAIAALRGKRA